MKNARKRTIQVFAIVALLAIAGSVKKAASADLPDNWTTDWESALKEARRSGKPVLSVFSTSWCGPCQRMIKDVYPQAKVKTALKDWVAVYVDADEHRGLAAKYDIEGYPTFVLLSPDGVEEDRVLGAFRTAGFLEYLGDHLKYRARLKEIKTRLQAAPEEAANWAELGTLYEDQGLEEQAITAYEKAVYYDPKDKTGIADDLAILRAIPRLVSDLEKAGAKLEAFEAKFPNSPLVAKSVLYRAWVAADLEDVPKAVEILSEGLERFTDSTYADQMRYTLAQLKPYLEQ